MQTYTPDELYQVLINKIRKYHPSEDVTMIEKAYHLAKGAHEGQLRKSGEPYIIHPLSVACILADLELDKESITAGILHDVVEDTVYSIEEIKEMFGSEVALLVDGVTKLTNLPYNESSKEEIQAENYRKMFLAMAKDIRVILIKLADRLHNMQTMRSMPKEKQLRISTETLSIYAPLANRLGISRIKAELEDLSLKYLDDIAYNDIKEKVAKKFSERNDFIQGIVRDVKKHIEDAGIKAEVMGRPKHFFSIYKKMVNQDKTIDQIYDLFAIRAIVDSIKDCYGVLGVIHEMYKPISGRFKDYIAMPKSNMYQSLHTTLIGPGGEPFEMQIRTVEMHKTAEYGIAAHWKYKENQSGVSTAVKEEQKLNWLRQILEWQRDMSDNKEFMDALKTDLNVFNDQVYAFTPKGEVYNLPSGSTPIDFAYMIHSAIGNKMVGARVNGKIVTFDYTIENGDQIEILTSQNSKGPSRDWLKIAKSTQAKNKINAWFRKENKEENILRGKELLEKGAKVKNIPLDKVMVSKYQKKAMQRYGFQDWDSILAAIGHGGLKEGQVINQMLTYYERDIHKERKPEEILKEVVETQKVSPKKTKSGIVVKGIEDLAVRFSRCCTPIPGDEIVGYVTRGRGISIHRTDCENIIGMSLDERERLIDAEWQQEATEKKDLTYKVDVQIVSADRPALVVDISRVIADAGINLLNFSARKVDVTHAVTTLSLEIRGKQELENLLRKINGIEGVFEVIRTKG
ncbi:MAG: bifunctional (p)ppGpp synthetase/guanosine-3',5'-bis(diphosphate) 3'-pyrophosphohydrolase [Eubacteriales bacterium]|nr:bifunctional (p)ppGpp synthetase/guanosine-3',5'-bis(diphosphate) 3'-pyrophosphohydrolase [Eubacteriales bacterium]